MDRFSEIFISWGPMLLLIVVWIFFMRKWKAPQDQTLNYLNEQVELLKHQNQIAERIAAALEKMERKSP